MSKLALASIPLVFVLATACGAGPAEDSAAAEEPPTDDQGADVSYSIGWQTGSGFRQQGVEIDADLFVEGLRQALAEGDPRWSEQEMVAALQKFQQEFMAKQQARMAEMGTANAAAGKAFLENNATRDGVMTTASGLQYEVMSATDGARPTATDRVTVHYHGTLIDGTVFDSSVDRGTPATFGLNGVIRGWTEGLQLMGVGSKYKFYIPAELAYGPGGQGRIGPNSTLIFEVELLGIEGR